MNILFVGAGGAGVGALVRWHIALGDIVYLQDNGISPAELIEKYPESKPFEAEANVVLDRAIFSDAIPTNHALRTFAHENKIPVRSYAQELGALSEGRNLIAVAGTHGKSTTTALIAWVLAHTQQDPLCIIGAEIKKWHGGFRFGNGPVVVEADEFKKHFLELRPTIILITSLEADHFDTYATEDELVQTFVDFCTQQSVRSVFVARGSLLADRLSEQLATLGRSHVRFGTDDDLVHATDTQIINGESHLHISVNEKKFDVELQTVTCPHVSNLLGTIAVLQHLGVPPELLQEGIRSFPGILRRLELLGNIEGVPLYSDYAHHPTAVRETLHILRRIFPNAKIGVIFEPHERLRTSTLREEYRTAFVDADAIGLLPVYDPVGRERRDILDSATLLSPSGDVAQLPDYPSAFIWAKKFAVTSPQNSSDVLQNTRTYGDEKILVIMGAGPIDGAFRKKSEKNV